MAVASTLAVIRARIRWICCTATVAGRCSSGWDAHVGLAVDDLVPPAGGDARDREGALGAVEVSLAPHSVPQVLALAHDAAQLVVAVGAQPGRPDNFARLS